MNKQDKELLEAYRDKLELIKNGARANLTETKTEQAKRIQRAKDDVGFCTEYYFSHYMQAQDGSIVKSADWQIDLAVQAANDPTCKILVRWGRGLAKSVWCDIFIPFWLWLRGDTFYMVLVGNNFDKAKILLSDLQAEFEANPRIIHDFGEQLSKGHWTKGHFRTKNGFVAKALGMGQSPRGLRMGARRPDLIVGDDLEDRETAKNPIRQKEIVNWITNDLIPTMDGPRRRYLHPNNDFAPVTIQNMIERKYRAGKRGAKWKLSRINAFDPITFEPAWKSKYTPQYYRDLVEEIGTIAANAEYNNDGVIQGELFKEEMLQWAKRPRLDHFEVLLGVWDVAYSGNNDFNAVPVWGLKGRELWKVKQFCKQCKMDAPIRFMYEYQAALPGGAEVLWMVESQFWNEPVQEALEEVELEYGYPLNITVVERSRMDKFLRILTTHPLYQSKRIKYAESERHDEDMKVACAQLFGIEPGYKSHDDAPDADEMSIHEILKIMRNERPEKVRTISRKKLITRQKNRF